MTRRKYDTPEEAAAAKREQARLRRAIIQQLIDEHKQQTRARDTEAAARARLTPPQPQIRQPSTAAMDSWRRMLNHTATRSFIIHALLNEYYDELKAELDAFRLIQGK